MESVTLSARRYAGGPVVDTVTRVPAARRGYAVIKYRCRMYQLFGGPLARADYRINLSLPLGRRNESIHVQSKRPG